jgi:hypothetical protein
MVYLIQSYLGLPVYNQVLVLAFKNDQLYQSWQFNISIEKQVNVKNAVPGISADKAILAALADRKLSTTDMPVVLDRKENGNKIVFSKMGISMENITAQLMWVPVEKTGMVRLAWEVYIIPKTTSDYWLVRVDAIDNSILDIDNLTTYCNIVRLANMTFNLQRNGK